MLRRKAAPMMRARRHILSPAQRGLAILDAREIHIRQHIMDEVTVNFLIFRFLLVLLAAGPLLFMVFRALPLRLN